MEITPDNVRILNKNKSISMPLATYIRGCYAASIPCSSKTPISYCTEVIVRWKLRSIITLVI